MPSKSRFRPCIDLHNGQVKQIVGGTLSGTGQPVTNYVSEHSSAYYANLYKQNNLRGGHVIKLGPGNDAAAKEALQAWPGSLQIGGGINEDNALYWLEAGAEKVIVTSYLFPSGKFDRGRLERLSAFVGRNRLVVDVSCRRRDSDWIVTMNKWQDPTDMHVSKETLDSLASYCSEFLVHAADVEGLCNGIDEDLVTSAFASVCIQHFKVEELGEWTSIPTTYAGGAKSIDDLDLVDRLSRGKVDLTYGSSLDIFGGTLVNFEGLVKKDQQT